MNKLLSSAIPIVLALTACAQTPIIYDGKPIYSSCVPIDGFSPAGGIKCTELSYEEFRQTLSLPVRGREEIQLEKRGSSYYVPVRINDTITMPFLLDTGADDLVIPADVARTLIRAGALKSGDLIGKRSYQIANGSEEVSPLVRIGEVRVGERVVRNVTAGITPANGEPLLGQSFLSKFGTLTVDYKRLVLTLSP